MTENDDANMLELRRRRLRFRCWHRGMKEADLLLGSFADRYLEDMPEPEIRQLEALMLCPDPDIVAWLSGAADAPMELDSSFANKLRKHSYQLDLS